MWILDLELLSCIFPIQTVVTLFRCEEWQIKSIIFNMVSHADRLKVARL